MSNNTGTDSSGLVDDEVVREVDQTCEDATLWLLLAVLFTNERMGKIVTRMISIHDGSEIAIERKTVTSSEKGMM